MRADARTSFLFIVTNFRRFIKHFGSPKRTARQNAPFPRRGCARGYFFPPAAGARTGTSSHAAGTRTRAHLPPRRRCAHGDFFLRRRCAHGYFFPRRRCAHGDFFLLPPKAGERRPRRQEARADKKARGGACPCGCEISCGTGRRRTSPAYCRGRRASCCSGGYPAPRPSARRRAFARARAWKGPRRRRSGTYCPCRCAS